MALFATAKEGCKLCKTIWGRRFKSNGLATAKDIRIEFCWNPTEEASRDSRRLGDVRLGCIVAFTVTQNQNKHTWETIFRFRLWPSSAFNSFFEVEGSVPLGPIERGNTRSSRLGFALAVRVQGQCR